MPLWKRLDMHSALYACALHLPSLVLRDYLRSLYDHWFMNFPKDLEAFLSSLGRSQRSKLCRKYKQVLNSFSGRMQVRSFRTISDLEQAIPDMEQIACKSVKRQLGYGFFLTLYRPANNYVSRRHVDGCGFTSSTSRKSPFPFGRELFMNAACRQITRVSMRPGAPSRREFFFFLTSWRISAMRMSRPSIWATGTASSTSVSAMCGAPKRVFRFMHPNSVHSN
jgi:hypothetical protein